MGRPRSWAKRGGLTLPARLALVLPLWLCAACNVAPARVWNLNQLHTPDGEPRRRGNLKTDLGYTFSSLAQASSFGGPQFQAEQAREKRISDPLGTCLENVVALAECERDERVAGLQAEAFAWLAVDCTYVLSRERCAYELGALGQALRLGEPPSDGTPSTPEEVFAGVKHLVEVMRQVLEAPAFAGNALAEACAAARALTPDRQGTLRMLRATSALLEIGEKGAVFAPLRELRLALARRAVVLALDEALEDPNGRVRAAALESSVRALPARRAAVLRRALLDPQSGVEAAEQVSLRALELLAAHGLPSVPAGGEEAEDEPEWSDILVQILRSQPGGPHGVAACRAMQRALGGEPSLRPEVWIARWREARAGAAPSDKGTAP